MDGRLRFFEHSMEQQQEQQKRQAFLHKQQLQQQQQVPQLKRTALLPILMRFLLIISFCM